MKSILVFAICIILLKESVQTPASQNINVLQSFKKKDLVQFSLQNLLRSPVGNTKCSDSSPICLSAIFLQFFDIMNHGGDILIDNAALLVYYLFDIDLDEKMLEACEDKYDNTTNVCEKAAGFTNCIDEYMMEMNIGEEESDETSEEENSDETTKERP